MTAETDVPNDVPSAAPCPVARRRADKAKVARLCIDPMFNRTSQITRVVGVTSRRVFSIQRELVAAGILIKEPGSWPASFRPGPNYDSYAVGEVRPGVKRGVKRETPKTTFGTARFHRIQLAMNCLGQPALPTEGVRSWKSGRGGRRTFHRFPISVNGRSICVELRDRTLLISVPNIEAHGEAEYRAVPTRVRDAVVEILPVAAKVLRVELVPKTVTWEIAVEDYSRVFQLSQRFRFRSPDGKAWTDFSKGFAEWETNDFERGYQAFRLPGLMSEYDRVTFIREGALGTASTTVYVSIRLEQRVRAVQTENSEPGGRDSRSEGRESEECLTPSPSSTPPPKDVPTATNDNREAAQTWPSGSGSMRPCATP